MTLKYIIKKDKSVEDFDFNKVRSSVFLAAVNALEQIDYSEIEDFLSYIEDDLNYDFEDVDTITSSDIESVIISTFRDSLYDSIEKQYYHYQIEKAKKKRSAADINDNIQKLIEFDKEVVNENANKDADVFNTQRDLTAGLVAKSKALEHFLPKKIANAHLKGQIHWHDMDYHPYQPMTNCCVIDPVKILRDTVKLGNATIKEPNSIGVAAAKLVQCVLGISGQQYGNQLTAVVK